MLQKSKFQISSAGLHILAMTLMLCDHTWAMLFPAAEWLTCIGRIAFPIFAFMVVEGFFHTSDLHRYLLRLLIGAVLSEIPFNLMMGGSILYLYHQNVLWTLLLGLLVISAIEKSKQRLGIMRTIPVVIVLAAAGYVLGYIGMLDYYGAGVLTVLTFYLFHKRTWTNFLFQFLCLYILNVEVLSGLYYDLTLFGFHFEIAQQGFALFSLVPIWLYRGKQGYHSRGFQRFCYAFYPVHMLILFAIREVWLSFI